MGYKPKIEIKNKFKEDALTLAMRADNKEINDIIQSYIDNMKEKENIVSEDLISRETKDKNSGKKRNTYNVSSSGGIDELRDSGIKAKRIIEQVKEEGFSISDILKINSRKFEIQGTQLFSIRGTSSSPTTNSSSKRAGISSAVDTKNKTIVVDFTDLKKINMIVNEPHYDELLKTHVKYMKEWEENKKLLTQLLNSTSLELNSMKKSSEDQLKEINSLRKSLQEKDAIIAKQKDDFNTINENLEVYLKKDLHINKDRSRSTYLGKKFLLERVNFSNDIICEMLGQDILDYCEYIKDQNINFRESVSRILDLVKEAIEYANLDLEIKLYGSHATGLCLPWSDLDLVLVCKKQLTTSPVSMLRDLYEVIKVKL